jgi:hypothetical protein
MAGVADRSGNDPAREIPRSEPASGNRRSFLGALFGVGSALVVQRISPVRYLQSRTAFYELNFAKIRSYLRPGHQVKTRRVLPGREI